MNWSQIGCMEGMIEKVKIDIMNLLSSIKIVIAENDPAYAESLKAHIKNQLVKAESNLSYEIKHYDSAQGCLNNLEKNTDILLLDCSIDDHATEGQNKYSGKELLKIIKGFCQNCKVIALSGNHDEDVIELFHSGIYEYIVRDEDTFVRLSSTLKRAIRDKILDHYI